MKTIEFKIYKILSYLLLLPNAFISLIALILLIVAPFISLLFLAVVLYTITSFIFLTKGLISGKMCSQKLRRNIRYTSILGLIFSVYIISLSIILVQNPSLIGVAEIPASIKKMPNFNQAEFERSMQLVNNLMPYLVFIYGALQMLHILMTYKFTKLYADIFIDVKR